MTTKAAVILYSISLWLSNRIAIQKDDDAIRASSSGKLDGTLSYYPSGGSHGSASGQVDCESSDINQC